ncbi:histone H3-H4 chaperone, CAF assembly factor (CAF-1) complex subunit A Pcf1 [Schizosaccharomyces osmophilus]|uniref:Histone H3-H4 chaperone, CAF assembly factor (CAF-1) complex subunit A Pcf1 n=1 Tax=Schizosaccharomyces osmophilus TaxID=2545709 RepID=A0AAE9WDM3_9SCHI|nr:histone H3-H4 chaperone, CAF assembly factor (CAF-1) complex subunit A Pcf1 [Schizosaccharomyces osmophilus]WBW73990.1 histone H3-H4 chaperone, CAF assembly factor (CAF-1) complex subunit A Pcf1 [Schizosaccharomyces osmophilus]
MDVDENISSKCEIASQDSQNDPITKEEGGSEGAYANKNDGVNNTMDVDDLPLSEDSALSKSSKRKRTNTESIEAANERKLERQRIQEEKARKKEEDRLRREREREQREIEKKQREEERLAAKKKRELEKMEKELEQQKKKEERDQKQREKEEALRVKQEQFASREKQQLKLNNFFSRGKASNKESPVREQEQPATDFDKTFRPFFLKSQTAFAKFPPCAHSFDQLDKLLTSTSDDSLTIKKLLSSSRSSRSTTKPPLAGSPKGFQSQWVKQCMERFQDPITSNPEDILQQVSKAPIKLIYFAEDIRPPYFGTFTKQHTEEDVYVNPWLEDKSIDYGYDSEAEWVADDEEGEDLDSEDDELDNSDDNLDEADAGFVDDDNDKESASSERANGLVGPLQPIIEGPCWDSNFLSDFSCISLLDPITPFSTSSSFRINPQKNYWAPRGRSSEVSVSSTTQDTSPSSLQVKLPSEDLPNFLGYIIKSHENKILLIEHLRQLFPHVTKNVISDTLNKVAVRRGKAVSDGWDIKQEFQSFLSS